MNMDLSGRGGFEERLLDELRSLVVAQPAGPRRQRRRPRPWFPGWSRRRLALVGSVAALLAVAAAAGVPLLSGGAAPAYAVSRNDDSTVTVEISSLSDAAGLERKLREAGIRAVVQYLPPGKACKQPWFTPASPEAAPRGEPAIKGGVEHTSDGRTRFTISKDLPADETLVIMTQTAAASDPSGAGGRESVGVAVAKGEVNQCEIVDAPTGSQPFGPPPPGTLHTEQNMPGVGKSTSDAESR